MNIYQYEARRDFTFNICRLGLWYLYTRALSGKVFDEVLNRQLPIYRLTTLWDGIHHPANPGFQWEGSQWLRVVEALRVLLIENHSSCAAFEEEGFELLRPYIEGRIEKDIKQWPWIPCGFSSIWLPAENVFDIFACDVVGRGEKNVSFHMANCCMPESPFKDMDARANGLLNMIRTIKRRVPFAEKIGCHSWLNSFGSFLRLFPDSYFQRAATLSQVGYGFDWWGQFVSRDGGFHDRHGKMMRDTGEFPFVPKAGLCCIDELEEHLLMNFNQTEAK